MIIVYAIYDEVLKEVYVGLTNNLSRRAREHKNGHSKYTKKFKSIKLFYSKKFTDYKTAREYEKKLKSGYGKEFLKEKLKQAGIV